MANKRLSDLLQILVYLKLNEGQRVPSTLLAASLNTNASLVRQMVMQLRNAGILGAHHTPQNPDFTKPLDQVTVLDVYKATEPKNDFLIADHETSQKCTIGISFPNVLCSHFKKIQEETERQMSQITVQQLVDETKQDIQQHELKEVE